MVELKFELWMKRIMDCRSSGLSDLQWCKEHDIKPPTFYLHMDFACKLFS